MSSVLSIFYQLFLHMIDVKINLFYTIKNNDSRCHMNRIKELRKSKRVTQADVAKYIGITQNNFSYWENGKVKIDNESLQKLADYFGVSVDYLLGRDTKEQLPNTVRSNLIIPEILQNVGIGFHNGAENLSQEDIDDMALALEIGRKRRENR